MENLGCITFRESLLLIDPATSTQAEQQNIADVVAHELAHMWFGDLVTMRWWNGIWLNEAFATFMELAACDAYRPEWGRWTLFGLERSAAFETDSLRSTRPVEYEVRSPHDCEGMFDVLTYQKGGALLRMLEQYLGEDRFRAGVSHYLRSHAYSNTETNDLWDAIEETTGDPVRRMMDSWIWQPGYPLVSASLDGDQLVLRQQRFAYDDATLEADESPTTWLVPVHVRNGATTTTVLLDGVEARTELPDPDGAVVVNAGGHGFFRVGYHPELRRRIAGEVLGSLDTLERYNLVDDAWNEVVAGRLAAADFLAFVEGFGGEDELAVWQAIVIGLRGLGRLVDDADLPALQARIRTLLAPAVARLGEPVDGEDDLRAKLRGLLTAALAIQGADEATRARAAERVPTQRGRRRGRSIPSSSPPPRRSSPRRPTRRRSSNWSTGSAMAPRRRTSCATCSPSPRSTPRSCCCGRASSPWAARSRRRTPRSCCACASPTGRTARRRGSSCASAGMRPTPASRATRSCGWSTR